MEHAFVVEIANINQKIYTRSDLYYGIDEARKKFRQLSKKTNCFPSAIPSANNEIRSCNPCFPINSIDSDELQGTSNWDLCMERASSIIQIGESIPQLNSNIGLIGAFFYNWDFLQVEKTNTTINKLVNKAKSFCSQNKTYQIDYNQKMNAPAPHEYCFSVAYITALLKEYKIKNNFDVYDVITHNQQEIQIQWAYGAMLYQINHLSWEYHSLTEMIFLIIIVILLLLLLKNCKNCITTNDETIQENGTTKEKEPLVKKVNIQGILSF